MTDLSDFISDNYGLCSLGPNCECLKQGNTWLGKACQNWRPVPYRSWDEMLEASRQKSPDRYFRTDEIDVLRQQLRENVERAVEIQKQRGHGPNPRIAAMRGDDNV